MIQEALADAGLTLADVDGVTHWQSSILLAEYLGIHPRYTDSTNTGGSASRCTSSTRPRRSRRASATSSSASTR